MADDRSHCRWDEERLRNPPRIGDQLSEEAAERIYRSIPSWVLQKAHQVCAQSRAEPPEE